MTNTSRGLAAVAVRNAIMDRILGGATRDWNAFLLAADKKADERDAKTKGERDAKRIADTKPSHDLAAYTGTYESSGYGTATVTVDGGSLVLHWARTPVPLTHWHYDTFRMLDEVNEYDELIEFRSDATDGHVRSMTFFGQEMVRRAKGEG